jgi:hypothetical protein
MSLPTPPLTPTTRVAMSPHRYRPAHSSPLAMPTDFALPPPLEVPELEMPAPSLESPECATAPEDTPQETPAEMVWRPGMSRQERDARDAWLAGARGRKGLRIVIVTGELQA